MNNPIRSLAMMATFLLFTVGARAAITEAAPAKAEFDPQQIHLAVTKLTAALQDPDPTAWVYMYTEDAGLLEAGSEPLQGRAKLLELAKTMQPMSSLKISPARIEGDGALAYMVGKASWVNGRAAQAEPSSNVQLFIVWRKGSDGQWRVAQEVMVPEKK